MYKDTITLFVRKPAKTGDTWTPIVLTGVDLNADRGAIIAQYGAESKDTAKLHIKYAVNDTGAIVINGYVYIPPKEYARLTSTAGHITFASGNDFCFFIEGLWPNSNIINDTDYTDGFYNYMNSQYDHCYAITSAARYSVIPHFEVLAK